MLRATRCALLFSAILLFALCTLDAWRRPDEGQANAVVSQVVAVKGSGSRVNYLSMYIDYPPLDGYKSHIAQFVKEALVSAQLRHMTGIPIYIVKDPAADILLCANRCEKQAGSPFQSRMIVETGDSAAVATDLVNLHSSSLLAVFKQYAWRTRQRRCSEGGWRPHYHLLSSFQNSTSAPARPLTVEEAQHFALADHQCPEANEADIRSKVYNAIPFHTAVWPDPESLPFDRLTPLEKRNIHVMFSGSVRSAPQHRRALIKALEAFKQSHPELNVYVHPHRLQKEAFFEKLRDTRVFVSPLGFGEYSGKDMQAVLSGAVMVKPLAALLEDVTGIFQPGIACIDVRPDWVGLDRVLLDSLSNMTLLRRIQKEALKRVSRFLGMGNALRQRDLLKRYAGVIKQAADRKAAARAHSPRLF